MAPKDVPILILGSWEFVTLYPTRDSAGVMKVRTLRWEMTPDYLGPIYHKNPCHQRTFPSCGQRELWLWEDGQREATVLASKTEEGP